MVTTQIIGPNLNSMQYVGSSNLAVSIPDIWDNAFLRRDFEKVLSEYKSRNNFDILPSLESDLISVGVDSIELVSRIPMTFNGNVGLLKTPLDFLQYLEHRALVYREMGYDKQFPRKLPELEYDEFDRRSIALGYKERGELLANLRIILDSPEKLPSDKVTSLDSVRNNFGLIGEISRVMVSPKARGKGLLNLLMREAVDLAFLLGIDSFVLGTTKEHMPIYQKFGSQELLYEGNYGAINKDCVVFNLDLRKNEWN